MSAQAKTHGVQSIQSVNSYRLMQICIHCGPAFETRNAQKFEQKPLCCAELFFGSGVRLQRRHCLCSQGDNVIPTREPLLPLTLPPSLPPSLWFSGFGPGSRVYMQVEDERPSWSVGSRRINWITKFGCSVRVSRVMIAFRKSS